MKILILGSGGREHAFAWRLSKDEIVESITVMPGNPGMTFTPKVSLLDVDWKNKIEFLKAVEKLGPDLVLIGPETPLTAGVADWLRVEGVNVIGPSALAAELEGSKIFAKKFMEKYEIPTAEFEIFYNADQAREYILSIDISKGIVIKADELAAGKGVVVTRDLDEALKTIYDFMENPDCTVKTSGIVLEKILYGKELSTFVLCDGRDYKILGHACDYKRVFDNDMGPNTGGMGGYNPKNWPGPELEAQIESKVIRPTLRGMSSEGRPFKGFLFLGLMIDQDQFSVIEYNVRMGDPETQILMPLLKGNFAECLLKTAKNNLKNADIKVTTDSGTAVHLVMTSEGYPSVDGTALNLGNKIIIPEKYIAGIEKDKNLFFAGVKKDNSGNLINGGGRVMGITVVGKDLNEAREKVYQAVKEFNFKGMHFRNDIARI